MKALLVDVDSKISNLALMKLSMHHKSKGDHVALYRHRNMVNGRVPDKVPCDIWSPDRVYVSCVFTWNRPIAERISAAWDGHSVVGGTGFDWGKPAAERSYLPPEVEVLPPDYDLYGYDYALGFCNRGCNRRCTFCDVPKSEGRIDPLRYRHPRTWVPDGFTKAMLLDNDIALYPDAQHDEILRWFLESGVKCSITQGYDLRCVTPQRAALLAELRPRSYKFNDIMLYCAWDYVGIEPYVRRGLTMLKDAGIRGTDITCYMIVGHDPKTNGATPVGDPKERENAMHRYRVLWEELGVLPYSQPYNNRRDDPWIRAFTRWVNRKLFKSCTWEDYRRRPKT